MIVLVHAAPNGTVVGVWTSTGGQTQSDYSDPAYRAYGQSVVSGNVPSRSWDDFCDSLAESASPIARWSKVEVPDGTPLSTVLKDQEN